MPRKREPTSDDILKRMYPDIMSSEDYEQKDPPTQPPQNQQSSAEVAELKAQIAALQGRLDSQSRANTALTTRQGPEVAPQPPQIDFKQAPNPVDDPEGYAAFITRAINVQVQHEKDMFYHQQGQQQSLQQRTDYLWNEFSAKYPDHAKDDRRVAIAAKEVVARAQAKRQDIDKYMYDNSEAFMQDVVKEMEALWGPVKQATARDDDDDDGEDGRTDGLFGSGQQSGDDPATPPKPAQKYGDLGNDLIAWQKKMGLRH